LGIVNYSIPPTAGDYFMNELAALFQRLDWLNVIDIGLVALIFFVVLYLMRGTQAEPLLRGLIILLVVVAFLGNTLTLPAFRWIFGRAIPALLIAIPVVFQPELRRALERVGRAGQLLTQTPRHSAGVDHTIGVIAHASQRLADCKHGALIVLERSTGLQNYADTGVAIDSLITSELLQTIFFRNTALHDGAVIVRDNRVLAAACILPLTSSYMSDRRLGLRHRAAIGITEAADAIAIVVSEEHGTISIAQNGRLIRRLGAQRLETVLRAFYQLDRRAAPRPRWLRWLRRALGGRERSPAEIAPAAAEAVRPRRMVDG
jgi:diadenylate cyclase